MPHYRNGRTAWIGDVVRGTGYNVKDTRGNPLEVVGTVIGLEPSRDECNLQIAVTRFFPVKFVAACEDEHGEGAWLGPENQRPEITGDGQRSINGDGPKIGAQLFVEYGKCDEFSLVVGIMRAVRIEGKPTFVRPIVGAGELLEILKASNSYRVFRENHNELWQDEEISALSFVEVADGDSFYAVPPARM